MPWEKRHQKSYYYRKRRQGDRVISEYIGTGELAETVAHLDQSLRQARQAEREARAALQALDAEVDHVCDLIRALTHACLLAAGFHTHKGQWRKKRKEKNHDRPSACTPK